MKESAPKPIMCKCNLPNCIPNYKLVRLTQKMSKKYIYIIFSTKITFKKNRNMFNQHGLPVLSLQEAIHSR